jgi:hypothetical protein
MFRVTRDHVPDCTEQKTALRRAEQRLEQAHEKLKLVRQWGRELPTLIDEYLAQAQQLGNYLVDDLARGTAGLDRMIEALEGYLSVASASEQPASAGWGPASQETPPDEKSEPNSLNRGDLNAAS